MRYSRTTRTRVALTKEEARQNIVCARYFPSNPEQKLKEEIVVYENDGGMLRRIFKIAEIPENIDLEDDESALLEFARNNMPDQIIFS